MSEDSSENQEPVRHKLIGGHRWPKDRHGDEIDVGDFLMFVNWCANYPNASLGRVIKIGKTGKVHVQLIKLHPREEVREIEIKHSTATRLGPAVMNGFMLEKLSRNI